MEEYRVDLEAGEELDLDSMIIADLPDHWNWCVNGESYKVVPVAEYKGFRVGDTVYYYVNPTDLVSPYQLHILECFVYVPPDSYYSVSDKTEIYAAFKGMGFSPIENIKYV